MHMTYEGVPPSREVGLENRRATSSTCFFTFSDLPELKGGHGTMLDNTGRQSNLHNVEFVNGRWYFEQLQPDLTRPVADQHPRTFEIKDFRGVRVGISKINELALILLQDVQFKELIELRDRASTGE